MTNEIEQIRERCEQATPGPWAVKLHNEDYGQGYGETTYFVDMGGTMLKIGIADSAEKCAQYSAIADFIAHARGDVPALITDHDRLTAEVERLTARAELAERERDELRKELDKANNRAEYMATIQPGNW